MPSMLARPALVCVVLMDRDYSRSRAILIANAVFTNKAIEDLPAARGCAPAMKELLTSDLCGWPENRVATLEDVALPSELATWLVNLTEGIEDVLLLYYVGHGMRMPNGQLALALRDTSSNRTLLQHTAMVYKHIADILRECPAATKVVILDCCHAELGNRANDQLQSADLDAEPVDGLYCIWASKEWEKAKSPLSGGLTYFTDAFVQVVRTGVTGKPAQLTIDQIFVELRARLLRASRPEPAQSGIRDAHHWPFAINAAPPQTHRDPDREIASLLEWKAAAEAREHALRAEIEDLKARKISAGTTEEKRQLQNVIDSAERLLDESGTALPAHDPAGDDTARLRRIANQVNSMENRFESLSDFGLSAMTGQFRERLAGGETLDDLLPEAFATVRETAKRTLGQRHFDVQIMGGAAMHWGMVAEVRDGEGKTLAATLPAYLNALVGKGVHVVTVNDYLARRDAEWMGPIHRFLGLEVGVIIAQTSLEERRESYAADITYGTSNEFGLDYLRDNMAWSLDERVQRGHHYAIVDEVDSILIDEAGTLLNVISPAEQSARWYTASAEIAARLRRSSASDADDGDYQVDEKKRTVGVLEPGVNKVQDWLGISNLSEPVNVPLVRYLNSAIKAKELYKRDEDYIVRAGEILQLDKFTRQTLQGRRYPEGLHEAIQAKEGVPVQATHTLARVSTQSYFRMYTKLAGMTGTAKTEAGELSSVYQLQVVEIPTNKPMIRADHSDVVYQTAEAKFDAVVGDLAERFMAGQPVLVGTTSVEKSELLSRLLKRRGILHHVLTAKYHERDAAMLAQAGRKGSVTVATNMAGRGIDIVLGGNPEFIADQELHQRGLSPVDTPEDYRKAWPQAVAKARRTVAEEHEEVVGLGGLCVLGTERHESQRIDNQLRGRSGHRGDPGESRFYLSMEDDLMRTLKSDEVASIMGMLRTAPEVPMDSKLVSRAIRSAQTQVEQQNFEIRKDILKYDDVLDQQRQVVYGERRMMLEGADCSQQIRQIIDHVVTAYVARATSDGYPEQWDLDKLWKACRQLYPISISAGAVIHQVGGAKANLTADHLTAAIQRDAQAAYDRREAELTPEIMREVERRVVLSVLDRRWRKHMNEMDYLREGIGLRAMAQRDPLVEYQREGYDMFNEMMEGIKEESVGSLFNLQIEVQQNPIAGDVQDGGVEVKRDSGDPFAYVGRNDPCPCGSGRKYKRCHGDPRLTTAKPKLL